MYGSIQWTACTTWRRVVTLTAKPSLYTFTLTWTAKSRRRYETLYFLSPLRISGGERAGLRSQDARHLDAANAEYGWYAAYGSNGLSHRMGLV